MAAEAVAWLGATLVIGAVALPVGPAESAFAPSPAWVVHDRYVRPVQLDNGTLVVRPAPDSLRPHVSEIAAAHQDLGRPRAGEL
jgi:hypothetical protein